ncbi:MAG: gamma-glutamylcyclotransferase [Planctomycetota bacterium]|nr:gamma-glutamylcyclotransferase [Planctomycetota bacterium]
MTIFVYGSLKRGQSRSAVLAQQRFLGHVVTRPKYRMYDLGAYPGLVPHDHGRSIEGELWGVDEGCLAELDQIEGVPTLYRRAQVELEQCQHDDVQTYFYQGPLEGRPDCGRRWP